MRMMVLSLMMVLIFGISFGVAGQDVKMCVQMGNILLEPPASVKQSRSKVNFPHGVHFNYNCRTCHHKWTGDAPIRNCTTSGCHDLKESPKEPTKYLVYTDSAIKYFKYAFHSQCIGCHKEIKTERVKIEASKKISDANLPATGPTGCIKCHPKQE
jgi:hypothetical protein